MRTWINIIVDESGSMMSRREAVISGFNEFVQCQKDVAPKSKCLVTLVRFNHEITEVFKRHNVKKVEELTSENYQPGGTTALYDAIGTTLNKCVKDAKTVKKNPPDKVITLILSDGLENASVEFTSGQICKMIKTLTEDGIHDFIFMGTNIDAIAEGAKIGIARKKAINFDSESTAPAFKVFTEKVSAFRAYSQDIEFDDADRETLVK